MILKAELIVRRFAKHLLASVIFYSGLLTFVRWICRQLFKNSDLVILMYHRVLEDAYASDEYTQPAIAVSVQTFERQMEYLAKNYTVVPLTHAADMLRTGRPLPRKCAVITFDDGWRDNYVHAYPILRRLKLPATIFLTTDYIDSDLKFWFLQVGFLLTEGTLSAQELVDACVEAQLVEGTTSSIDRVHLEAVATHRDKFINYLKRFDSRGTEQIITQLVRRTGLTNDQWPDRKWTLTWADIAEMDSSIIEYGSHGQSHQIMLTLTDDMISSELTVSRQILESRLKRPIVHFAYPNGDYNESIKRLVREAGYLSAVTAHAGGMHREYHDLYALHRIGLHEGATEGPDEKCSLPVFACIIEGIL